MRYQRKTLPKNTIKCDRCEKTLDPDNEKVLAFHNDMELEDTVYICEPCVLEVYNEYSKVIEIEEQN